ncbi:hypothetical protein ADL22_28500 [Streptomyces sp. NRRL F-4489]|uniref:hypothetical protein n=1 Tax=Streptomyces sp. NRRL F-4489 TaxID=1609095 RepID=UPI00074A49F6|nr:hypothetical protein [Streptomyces sp. NRRL F-4489]KUL35062.1 hypothetical protein ADL22_28500 [Streptomyces sp. NRRL F-4489]
MDFTLTPGEEAVVRHLAALLRAGTPPTDNDLADELGEEVRPLLQSLLEKGWLVVDDTRTLTLSVIARAAVSDGTDTEGPRP